MTNKKTMKKIKVQTKTMTRTKTFREHPETLIIFLTIENNNPGIHSNPSIKNDKGQH